MWKAYVTFNKLTYYFINEQVSSLLPVLLVAKQLSNMASETDIS